MQQQPARLKRHLISVLLTVLLVGGLLAPAAGAVGPTVDRLAGGDRFATAVAVSQDAFPFGASTVFVANGFGFPDALAGGVAAAAASGPILLVQTNSIPAVTATELTRLAPDEIVILGGPLAVSSSVETALGAYATTVRRVAGTDRFATAAAIAGDVFPSGTNTVILTNGFNFPDALAGVPAASKMAAAILLTRTDVLPSATATAITDLGASRVVILGGTLAVSSAVEAAVAGLSGVTSVERWGGTSRFDTAALISQRQWPCGADTVYVAYGFNFPDALAGGPAASRVDAPVLLMNTDTIPAATYNEIRRLRATKVVILGGTAVISDTAKAALETLLAMPVFNDPPTVRITSPANLATYFTNWNGLNWGVTVDLVSTTSDANCDAVTVVWSSDVQGDLGFAESISPRLTVPAGQDSSQPTITVTATDSYGATSSDSIQLKLIVPSP